MVTPAKEIKATKVGSLMSEYEIAPERLARPKKYPFTQWHAYGSPAYGIVPTEPVVEFVDQKTGRRTVIIDKNRRIVNFPGIENEEEIQRKLGEGSTIPFNLFGVSFTVAERDCYKMTWTIQLDGRFWEDENGFGGTSDNEIRLSAIINNDGQFITPFRLQR